MTKNVLPELVVKTTETTKSAFCMGRHRRHLPKSLFLRLNASNLHKYILKNKFVDLF